MDRCVGNAQPDVEGLQVRAGSAPRLLGAAGMRRSASLHCATTESQKSWLTNVEMRTPHLDRARTLGKRVSSRDIRRDQQDVAGTCRWDDARKNGRYSFEPRSLNCSASEANVSVA